MMREIQQQIGAPRLEVMEADHEAVIHALVAAGVGIGLLRQELAEMGEARGELKRLRTCAATARLSSSMPSNGSPTRHGRGGERAAGHLGPADA